MKNTIKTLAALLTVADLKPGQLFWFIDPVDGTVNKLTLFKRTASGFTNQVTKKQTRCIGAVKGMRGVVLAS